MRSLSPLGSCAFNKKLIGTLVFNKKTKKKKKKVISFSSTLERIALGL